MLMSFGLKKMQPTAGIFTLQPKTNVEIITKNKNLIAEESIEDLIGWDHHVSKGTFHINEVATRIRLFRLPHALRMLGILVDASTISTMFHPKFQPILIEFLSTKLVFQGNILRFFQSTKDSAG